MIPVELCLLSNLTYLDIGNNKLTGENIYLIPINKNMQLQGASQQIYLS